MRGITLNCASNYAFMAYKIEDMVFHDLEFNEGWDGIHIRGGKNITIRNCRFLREMTLLPVVIGRIW